MLWCTNKIHIGGYVIIFKKLLKEYGLFHWESSRYKKLGSQPSFYQKDYYKKNSSSKPRCLEKMFSYFKELRENSC